MKRIISYVVAITMIVICFNVTPVKGADAMKIQQINALITEGKMLSNDESAEAFEWVNKVEKISKDYSDTVIYSEIKSECSTAKNHSGISVFNSKNKIIGYLMFIRSYLNDEHIKKPMDLVNSVAGVSNSKSPEAFEWLAYVMAVNEKYDYTSVYNDLKSECNTAINHDMETFNSKSKIVAYLRTIDNEIPISSQLISISIISEPYKLYYDSGECFNSSGLRIAANYSCKYKDGSTNVLTKEVENFYVDTFTKLNTNNKSWTVSYTEDGVTKTVPIIINVMASDEESPLTPQIEKKYSPISIRTKTKSFKFKRMKKMNVKKKFIYFNNHGRKISFKKINSKKNKRILVNKNNGMVTIKKGIKKGKYKVKVKVFVMGDDEYLPYSKTVSFTVKIK